MIWSKISNDAQKTLMDDEVWWKKSQKSSVQQFLSQYTLHDSYWRGITYEYGGILHAIVSLDISHINPKQHKLDLLMTGEQMGSPHYSGKWPYLCIRFPNILQIVSNNNEKYVDDYLNGASTKMLTSEQRLEWLNSLLKLSIFDDDIGDFLLDEGIHVTTFEGTGKNYVHIIHNEPTYYLCIKDDGTILHLPDLEVHSDL